MDRKEYEAQSSSSSPLLTTPLLLLSSSSSSPPPPSSTDDVDTNVDPSSTISTTTTPICSSGATGHDTSNRHGDEPGIRPSAATAGESSTVEGEDDGQISFVEELLRAVAKLAMILFGMSVVLTIFFWPSFMVSRQLATSIKTNIGDKSMTTAILVTTTVLVQLLHIVLLIFVDKYLYVHRFVALPVRIPLMPILNFIVESEAKREKNATIWYNDCRSFPKIRLAVVGNSSSRGGNDIRRSSSSSDDGALSTLLTGGFKASTRRDIKQKLRYYNERRIKSRTQHSNFLSLRNDVPLIWEHQAKELRRRRGRGGESLNGENTTRNDNSTSNVSQSVPIGELLDAFLSRFLVVFLVPHAYIDRYYCPIDAMAEGREVTTPSSSAAVASNNTATPVTDEDQKHRLVALGMFVACDNVLLYNMYFSVDDPVVNSAGIWQYNHIRGLLRAVLCHNTGDGRGGYGHDNEEKSKRIDYINFFHHQDHAKKRVGALPAKPSNKELMRELFPFALYREPPQNIINVPMDLDHLLSKKNQDKTRRNN